VSAIEYLDLSYNNIENIQIESKFTLEINKALSIYYSIIKFERYFKVWLSKTSKFNE
jgi:E3 ubiquitin-protein ligase DOA10